MKVRKLFWAYAHVPQPLGSTTKNSNNKVEITSCTSFSSFCTTNELEWTNMPFPSLSLAPPSLSFPLRCSYEPPSYLCAASILTRSPPLVCFSWFCSHLKFISHVRCYIMMYPYGWGAIIVSGLHNPKLLFFVVKNTWSRNLLANRGCILKSKILKYVMEQVFWNTFKISLLFSELGILEV